MIFNIKSKCLDKEVKIVKKKLLLMGDMVGNGNIALSVMIPILTQMKYEIYNIPTSFISNNFNYGKFSILDTTKYLKETIEVWEKLDFKYDAIFVGYIASSEQANVIIDFCKKKAFENNIIFIDPIMADNGTLYNGIGEDTVRNMKKLISVADYIMPNYTEASYLSGIKYEKDGLSIEDYHNMIDILREYGVKSVIITSAKVKGENNRCSIGYDIKENSYFKIDYDEINTIVYGTGDIFSSLFIGKMMSGENMYNSTKYAMDTVREMIRLTIDDSDLHRGIPIENILDLL